MGREYVFIERRLRLKVNVSQTAAARPEEMHFSGFSLWQESRDRLLGLTTYGADTWYLGGFSAWDVRQEAAL